MADQPSKKVRAAAAVRPTSPGVPVRTFETRTRRYEDGVPVQAPETPEQNAGTDKKEKD